MIDVTNKGAETDVKDSKKYFKHKEDQDKILVSLSTSHLEVLKYYKWQLTIFNPKEPTSCIIYSEFKF